MKYAVFALGILIGSAADAGAQLRGSAFSIRRQYSVAQQNEYTFLRNSREVREFIQAERLVRVGNSPDYVVKGGIAFPYARPAVKLFVERLAAQYRAATGDRLVITSLTRPKSKQPRNASELSVHPAGMAVDLRVPAKAAHRKWLERALLSLEDEVVLDVTKERRPAHYHVAVFPREYERYVAALDN
jgi:hypothetical protein